jgi:hypothetical protein
MEINPIRRQIEELSSTGCPTTLTMQARPSGSPVLRELEDPAVWQNPERQELVASVASPRPVATLDRMTTARRGGELLDG